MNNPLDEIVQAQKRGEVRGIASICSAHPSVLKARTLKEPVWCKNSIRSQKPKQKAACNNRG